MPHFELGGSVSLSADQSFTSNFAQELARESSMVTADSVYKSSFAAEMLETSQAAAEASTEIVGDCAEDNIYENVATARLSLGSCVQDNVRHSLGSNSSFNFGRHSQVSICLLLLSRYQVTSEVSFQELFVCSICLQLQ